METAGYGCQCTGACGSRHSKSQGRCDHVHGGPATRHGGHLFAAPAHVAELSRAPHYAAGLHAADACEPLTLWATGPGPPVVLDHGEDFSGVQMPSPRRRSP